ncbi:hypothetical protein ACHAPJ_001986 [Fusarium lateritium]
MTEYLEDFQVLPSDQVPKGVKFGVSFTTVTVNAPGHLLYLYQSLQQQYGVTFVRQNISNIQEAFAKASTKIVFNCVGNAAKTLTGVEDPKCYPTRGQVLLARAPHVRANVMRHGLDYETYIIPRPESKGNIILGGYMQKGNPETESITQRTKALSKELASDEVEVLAAFSGLRSSRDGGARVERHDVNVASGSKIIVHNYGAGGTGFQAVYGMAVDAVATVDDILHQWDTETMSSKL